MGLGQGRAMVAPPSKLNQTTSADDEIDAILANTSTPPDSPEVKKGTQPIPANRIALMRRIEEDGREHRRRENFKHFGYQVILVITIAVAVGLFAMLFWMLYLAISSTAGGHPGRTIIPKKIVPVKGFHHPDIGKQIKEPPPPREKRIIHVPRKMPMRQ